MATHRYMVTRDYIAGWTIQHALREIIANGYDAQDEHGAAVAITHDKGKLVVANEGVRLDVRALYFGGTTKASRSDMIGQYGEGMKLALLVFAREEIDVRIVNDDEVWRVGFEIDGNGVEAFHIYTRKLDTPRGAVRFEVPGVSDELWDEIQAWFLRLMPPRQTIVTTVGEILLDYEHLGKRFSRGVYIDALRAASFGYNFKSLNVGRDRRSYRAHEADGFIAQMWAEASKSESAMAALFRALQAGSQDLASLQYYANDELVDAQVRVFRADYGEGAYPIESAGEGVELEHIGVKPVTLPRALVQILRKRLPSIYDIKQARAREVVFAYTADQLTEAERTVLRGVLDVGRRIGITQAPEIVDFRDENLEGLYISGVIRLAKKTLATFGKAMGVYLHEAAHGFGADGHVGHVNGIHRYMEAAFEVLWRERGRYQLSGVEEGGVSTEAASARS